MFTLRPMDEIPGKDPYYTRHSLVYSVTVIGVTETENGNVCMLLFYDYNTRNWRADFSGLEVNPDAFMGWIPLQLELNHVYA